MHVLKKLGMETMLSAWAGPLEGYQINKRLEASTLMVQTIHRSVVHHCKSKQVTSELISAVMQDIGLPPSAVNPLLSRTIQSHILYNSGK
jgi:hypothetical protein